MISGVSFLTLELVAFTIQGVSVTAVSSGTSIVTHVAPQTATLATYEVVGITVSAMTPDTSFIALRPGGTVSVSSKTVSARRRGNAYRGQLYGLQTLPLLLLEVYTHFICLYSFSFHRSWSKNRIRFFADFFPRVTS